MPVDPLALSLAPLVAPSHRVHIRGRAHGMHLAVGRIDDQATEGEETAAATPVVGVEDGATRVV